jgi:hypothetical protein
MKNKEISMFYNAVFDPVSVMDIDEFNYPLEKFTNYQFLTLATALFQNNTNLMKSLPSWRFMAGLAKLSSICSSENFTLGEILSLESILEERKICWLNFNEQFFNEIRESPHDGFTEEACRIYWDNLNMYGDLNLYSQGGGSFKNQLKKALHKYINL